MNALYIFVGCGLGGLCRYWLSNGIHMLAGRAFPYGTLFVNVSGSLLMGILFALIIERIHGSTTELRALLIIGFLGGYTTFSSFSMETLYLIEDGNIGLAALNVVLSVSLCLAAAWVGIKIISIVKPEQIVVYPVTGDIKEEVVDE